LIEKDKTAVQIFALRFLGGYGICSKKIAMRRYGERYKESVQFQN
jgi:hypothetical protein